MNVAENFPQFRFTHIARPDANVLTVRWSLQPTAYPLDDIVFEIFRSNGPKGPWDLIGAAEQGRFEFTDYNAIGDPISRNYYYVVRAASISGKGFADSEPQILQHDADNIAFELVRKKNLYLTTKGGISVAVLIKKSWGAKCSRCWNYERQSADDADCPECYATGFSGGFLNPVFIPALFNPPKNVVVEAGLKYEPYNVYAEMSNHPVLDSGDVIVDRKQNIRYTIEQINTTTRRMHTISQIALLNRVDENSIVYTIGVPEPVGAPQGRSWDMVERAR